MPSLKLESNNSQTEIEVSRAALRVMGLGAVAGLRSMTAPALLARAVNRGDTSLVGTRFGSLGRFAVPLQVLMIGEMIADKAPFVPSRTSRAALTGRVFSGALVGAALYASEGRRGSSGAPLGAVAAALGAFVGERLRSEGTRRLKVPDIILGHLEDGLALYVGTRLLKKGR